MPRAGNKKSRKGCVRCKLRKVKCDEQMPSCGWCQTHGVPCEYTGLPAATELQRQDITSELRQPSLHETAKSKELVTESTLINNPNLYRLELALMQYYVANIAPTFPYSEPNRQHGLHVHAELIPQEGLRCPCLLHAMYAYALLHMHMESENYGRYPRNYKHYESLGLRIKHDRTYAADHSIPIDLLSLHRDYLHQALQEQRAAIDKIDSDNADGVCVTSVLIACIALVHASQVEPSLLEYKPPIEWFYLQRSFTPCLDAARHILTMDSATNMMILGGPNVDNQFLPPIDQHGPFLQLLHWHPSSVLDYRNKEEEEAYARAVAYLQALHQHVSRNEPWQTLGRRILAFPSIVAEDYVKLVEDEQPRALVILAHILAFGQKIDRNWWIFEGVSYYHIHGITRYVPDEWRWAMSWPLGVLERGIESVTPSK